jgi:hypothetical protein
MVRSKKDAQNIVKQSLEKEYGKGISVIFLNTNLKTNESDGRKLWVVGGQAIIRRRLFWRKKRDFTFYIEAKKGKIFMTKTQKNISDQD